MKVAGGVRVIYVVETFELSDEARVDPSFDQWLRQFNALLLAKNPAVESIDVYASYTGPFEMEVWFGMEDFSSLDRTAEAEQAMFQDPELMDEYEKFMAYMNSLGRRITLGVE
jgi:hypothetical protein